MFYCTYPCADGIAAEIRQRAPRSKRLSKTGGMDVVAPLVRSDPAKGSARRGRIGMHVACGKVPADGRQ
jgi:hypothetical protein